MPELKTFYFTFGLGHPLASCVQVVRAPNEHLARCGMFRYYHDKWAFCYDKAEYVSDGKCVIGGCYYNVIRRFVTVYDEKEMGCE